MRAVPLTLVQANELIASTHRHHKPVQGHRFSVGAMKNGKLVGAAVVGRPVARMTDQYSVAEVTRLVTDGTKNACSFLYSTCARICREMGFAKIQTFIMESETGTSLLAAGWRMDGESGGGDWNRPSRDGRRVDQPQCAKRRWAKVLQQPPTPATREEK